MKLKEKLGIDAVAKFSVENPQWVMDIRMLSIYLAGFDKARKMALKMMKQDEDGDLDFVAFKLKDLGEEEVQE